MSKPSLREVKAPVWALTSSNKQSRGLISGLSDSKVWALSATPQSPGPKTECSVIQDPVIWQEYQRADSGCWLWCFHWESQALEKTCYQATEGLPCRKGVRFYFHVITGSQITTQPKGCWNNQLCPPTQCLSYEAVSSPCLGVCKPRLTTHLPWIH